MLSVPSRFVGLVAQLACDGILDGDAQRIAAWIYTESAFDPYAVRYEPAFYRAYVEPQMGLTSTEARCRAMSWGLFQIMGQVAREQGYDGKYLSSLCDPQVNADIASSILRQRRMATGSWDGALAAYNGGLRGNRRRPYRNQFYVEKVDRYAEMFG